ncbi:M23 family metallopeptidase [Nocardioides zeae]|uniref:M23 family metallopeptidase n=1 Tax=Nocardioides imazamoxiresistens TaxID=3231893 RepID=A0ABU3PXL2_9ACTN|nr:M23 family metallopeptidase [Nocardioides zeae]MDT9593973.1 M23 family metallopeptidase [Nocardioides zeae]
MVRTIAGWRPLWARLVVVLLLVVVLDVAAGLGLLPVDRLVPGGPVGVVAVVVALAVMPLLMGVAPRSERTDPVVLAPPVRGEWTAVNSPGQSIPSHGTRTRGQLSAIDVCGRSTASSPRLVRWGLRGTRPEAYPGFDAPVHAMAAGEVVRVVDRQRDHRARDTWQGLAWMMTLEGIVREVGGTPRVLGNHVVVRHQDGTVAVYAHLRCGSVTEAAVAAGSRVGVGDVLGRVGNTGNTSMPHLHVQVMDSVRTDAAAGLPLAWSRIETTGEIDPPFEAYAKEPAASALPGMPRNGEVFRAG